MKTKKEIEEILTDLLYDCLRSANQEDAIISLEYDEENDWPFVFFLKPGNHLFISIYKILNVSFLCLA